MKISVLENEAQFMAIKKPFVKYLILKQLEITTCDQTCE